MPQIILAKKKRPHLVMIAVVASVLAVGALLTVWYVVIPGGETVDNTIARAQSTAARDRAAYEDSNSSGERRDTATGGVKILSDRLVHTLLPKDRARIELAEGKLYLSDFNYGAAAKVLEQARRAGADAVEVDRGLAEAYDGLHDKTKAGHYFQKLVDYYSAPKREKTETNQKSKEFYLSELARVKG